MSRDHQRAPVSLLWAQWPGAGQLVGGADPEPELDGQGRTSSRHPAEPNAHGVCSALTVAYQECLDPVVASSLPWRCVLVLVVVDAFPKA